MTDYNPLMKIPYFFASVADGASWSETYDFCEAQTDKFKDITKIYNLLHDLGSEICGEEVDYNEELKTQEGKGMENAIASKYRIRLKQLRNVEELLRKKLNLITEQPKDDPTKTEKLKSEFSKYGFNKLESLNGWSDESINKLITLVVQNDLPYQIAMIEFLGFRKQIENEYFSVKNEVYKGIAEILGANVRSVKGNILVLNTISKENKERYTAHQYTEAVKKDYQRLK